MQFQHNLIYYGHTFGGFIPDEYKKCDSAMEDYQAMEAGEMEGLWTKDLVR